MPTWRRQRLCRCGRPNPAVGLVHEPQHMGGHVLKVSIVGGTGAFGRALAERLRDLDFDVAVGSREHQRGWERGAELGVRGGSNEEIVNDADLVVLAVKSDATIDTARELAAAIGETPVLCVASDVLFTEKGVLPAREERSLAEELAETIAAPVASGLQSVSAIELATSELPDQDALICGDDPRAKEPALELAGKLVGGRAIDVGPLANSRALEAMTAVILNVNKAYKAHAGLRLTGIPDK
jgi:NADPH-dependent F420 reductase